MDAKQVMFRVNEVVFPAFLVGGAVRDIVRGVIPDDWDFASPRLPGDIEDAITAAGKHVYGVGKAFGTLEFKLDGLKVQVTTFRTEQYRDGSRHPEVAFVADLEDDLSRRDFTVNAMAMDPDGDLIDPFGGQGDLVEGILRAVGTPVMRFKEDPLRMLRLARFASQLGFVPDPATLKKAVALGPRITQVSRNRWMPELDKLLMGDEVRHGLGVLAETGLLKYILPEIHLQVGYDQFTPYHSLTLWQHTKEVVALAPQVLDLRWAALLHDVGKPFVAREKAKNFVRDDVEVPQWTYIDHAIVGAELVAGIAARLHWSKQRTETVTNLVANHLSEDSPLKEHDNHSRG